MINLWCSSNYFDYLKYNRNKMSGPLKVFLNLKESLTECNIDFFINKNIYDKNLIIHYDSITYKQHKNLEYDSCFIGPQFWAFDSYGQFLVDNPRNYNQLIVPSEWVKNLLTIKFGVHTNKISVWPVGIKSTSLNKDIKYDCLVYFKRRSQRELKTVIEFLEKKNLSYNIITYGTYDENDFQLLASQSRFCFLLNGTESQGIAVQEIMNTNTPLFVWDLKEWLDKGEEYKVNSSSVPYWDKTCGEKFYYENEMEDNFSKFYDRIDSYNPKEFVEKNISYSRSVEILMEILNVN